jgi:hypothetical protein
MAGAKEQVVRKSVAALAALVATGLVATALSQPATAAAARAKPYVVTLKTSQAKATSGHKITLSGRVSGADAAGRVVLLERRYTAGVWQRTATATVTRSGRFSVRVKLVKGGTTKFRAVMPKSNRHGAGASDVRAVEVYKWLDITQQPHYYYGVGAANQPSTIGGKSFPNSVESYLGMGMVGFKADGLCSTVRVYTGFLDRDLPLLAGGETQMLIVQGGTLEAPSEDPAELETPVGPAVRRLIDVTGDEFVAMQFGVSAESAGTTATAVLASPQVLCNVDRLPAMDPLPIVSLTRQGR